MKAAISSNNYIGRGYDYGFSDASTEEYCSELVADCYREHDKSFLSKVESSVILPIDYHCDPDIQIIYDSRVKLVPQIPLSNLSV
jgi:hypothetical protein